MENIIISREAEGTTEFNINDKPFRTFRDFSETLKLITFAKDALTGTEAEYSGILPAVLIHGGERDEYTGDTLETDGTTVTVEYAGTTEKFPARDFAIALYSSIAQDLDIWGQSTYEYSTPETREKHRKNAKRTINRIEAVEKEISELIK